MKVPHPPEPEPVTVAVTERRTKNEERRTTSARSGIVVQPSHLHSGVDLKTGSLLHRASTRDVERLLGLDSTGMGTLFRDTGMAAEMELIAVMKRLPTWKKLKLLDDACQTTRTLVLAGLRKRFPELSEDELHRRLMDRLVGEETAERVWGPRVEPDR